MQAAHFLRHEIDSARWDDFVLRSAQGSVWLYADYLDIISENWSALILQDAGEWKAVLPLFIRKKWGVAYSLQPIPAQYSGCLFAQNSESKNYSHFSHQKALQQALLAAMPKISFFSHTFSPELSYLSPWHWAGYKLQNKYTFRLNLELEKETLWANLAPAHQRQIKKFQKQKNFSINEGQESKGLTALMENEMSKGKSYSGAANQEIFLEKIKKIGSFLLEKKLGTVYQARNERGEIIAAGLFSIFQDKCHYLAGAVNEEGQACGAMTALMWEAILGAKGKEIKIFDFDGSMNEGIEGFFRKFGAIPIPYLQISQNKLLSNLPSWILAFIS